MSDKFHLNKNGVFDKYGYHAPSSQVEESKQRFCPPGRIKSANPKQYRLRTTDGSNRHTSSRVRLQTSSSSNSRTVHVADRKDTAALEYYESKRSQGKVSARGAGFEPWWWQYDWPEQAKISAQNAEQRGLSTEPFINMLLKPLSERPRTFNECVNFFYPLSGTVPPAIEISPFISTSLVAYDVSNTREGGAAPLQLGEVSMMYGWYLAFRTMLCPTELQVQFDFLRNTFEQGNPAFPFYRLHGDFVRDPGELSRLAEEQAEDARLFSRIKAAVGVLGQAAQAVSNSDFEIPTSVPALLTSLGEAAEGVEFKEVISTYGPAAVASIVREYVNVPYTHANDIASLIIEGSMSKDKFDSLWNDRNEATDAVKGMVDSYVEDQIAIFVDKNLQSGAYGSVNELRDMFVTDAIPEHLSRKFNTLKQKSETALSPHEKIFIQAYSGRKSELEQLAQARLEDFSKYGNARENPILTTTLAIGLTVKAIEGGIEYHNRKNNKNLQARRKYLTEQVYQLAPTLTTDDIDFALGSGIRRGVWKDNWFRDDWANARLRPDCRLQQGGQLLDYWTHAWSRVQSFCRKYATERSKASTSTDQYISLDKLLQPKNSDNLRNVDYRCTTDNRGYCEGTDYRPRKTTFFREEHRIGHEYFDYHTNEKVTYSQYHCQGLGLLASRVDDSIEVVLQHADAFSPFTHAYGFAPTYYTEAATGVMKIDGIAPRRFLGHDNLTLKDSDDRFRWPAYAPGHLFPNRYHSKRPSDGDINTYYDLEGVECRAGVGPLPSRRLLEGVYGQRCNISFDVGIEAEIPVMDAQFCGLMACLLLHPEALDTCAKFGLPWAVELKKKSLAKTLGRMMKIAPSLFSPNLIAPALLSTNLIAPALLARGTRQLTPSKIQSALSRSPAVKLTPQLQASLNTLTKNALLDKIKIHPNVLDVLKRPSPVITKFSRVKAAKSPSLSTTHKVVGAVTATALVSGLTYVCYKIAKSSK